MVMFSDFIRLEYAKLQNFRETQGNNRKKTEKGHGIGSESNGDFLWIYTEHVNKIRCVI